MVWSLMGLYENYTIIVAYSHTIDLRILTQCRLEVNRKFETLPSVFMMK